ncbi:hypothetical protein [Virgisporangium ochraceum]|uniref:hypothetical protein n=1 Tax=Virgisporangium ochraceum TaxID=65505 RepID=UPI001944A5CF|nr:hypothetical protein [Virgisporangium ochraceum]
MYCPGCGTARDGRYPSCPWCGTSFGPPPARAGAGFAVLAVDIVSCGGVYAAGLAVAGLVATGRGAEGLHAATARLGWLHLLLAAAVLVAYRLGAQLAGGRTLGRILLEGAAATGTVPLFAPAVVTTLVLGTLTGVTAPPVRAGPAPVPSTASPTTDGRTQAIGLDTLIAASSNSRTRLRTALADADRCVDAEAAADTLRQVTAERDGQLSRARELPVDAIPNGRTIRDHLVAALAHSVAADRAFTAWADNVASGRCGQDANYAEAGRASTAATAAKRSFCSAWNPVAVGFGLPTRTEDEV